MRESLSGNGPIKAALFSSRQTRATLRGGPLPIKFSLSRKNDGTKDKKKIGPVFGQVLEYIDL